MNFENMKAVLDKIKEYDRIIIFRHKRPDGDAVGSTKGLREILRLTYPEKEISLINCDYSEYMLFLGGEDYPQDDEYYAGALGIVVDTATEDRISNPRYKLCKEIIKFDHHINIAPYGDVEWVEEERSSACEMVAEFCHTFKDELKINKEAATYIFTGMVTDSGRFRFRSVSGDTMRLAGMLLDVGIDIDKIYANLYMQDFETFDFKSYIYKHIKRTENGVAYLYVTRAMREKFDMSHETASATVSYMDSIRDSLIWIAFIDNDDGTIRVRLRSRFVTVSELAERYHGGGHACAAGATAYNKKEMKALLEEADKLLEEYKRNNEGWL